MICSSVNRFFTSNLLRMGDWTPNQRATQNRGDVDMTSSKAKLRNLAKTGFFKLMANAGVKRRRSRPP
jgi:hypothetical protein